MSKQLLYLLDGMALAYRAHFAFVRSNLRNSEGIPTGPIMGFANTIERLLEEQKPTHIAVAWDTHAPTFRHTKDETYKANRPPQPDELRVGIPLIKEMLEYWGIRNLEIDGYEADDLIGSIASEADEDDVNVFLVTPDKDFMQLVHNHIKMYKPDNKDGGFNIVDREGVKEYFGVYPEQVIDVLALIGDTSDNIPGVPGIGKKGAPELIQRFGSLENLLENAHTLSAKKQRESLIENAGMARHAKFMVTIKTDIAETPHWEDLQWDGAKATALAAFFKRMQFRTLLKKYSVQAVSSDGPQGDLFSGNEIPESEVPSVYPTYDAEAVSYTLINNEAGLKTLTGYLQNQASFCFDTETTGLDRFDSRVIGIALCAEKGKAFYVAVGKEGISSDVAGEWLRPVFEDESKLKIAHNLKFDLAMLRQMNIDVKGSVFDTMVAAYLIDSSQKLSMDTLSEQYLRYKPISITALIGEGKHQKNMDDLSPSEVFEYACEDADITFQLYQKFTALLEKDELINVAETVDFPLIAVLTEMEHHGVLIDTERLSHFSKELFDDIGLLQQKIFDLTGEEFNINSPQQLGTILFEKLKLPTSKKTKTGQYSTSETVLSELAPRYEIVASILEFRQLNKLKSTYVDALPSLIHPLTGRVHSEFNQTVAATGRLSSSNPNLQNIPIRTAKGREIRKAFVPAPEFSLLSADYSQVELRVIASIAKDRAMMEAFKRGEDIHARTAKEIFGLNSLEDVLPEHRRKAKEVNFGIPYGVSPYGLATRLGIENSEAKAIIDAYFARFSGILEYINLAKEKAREMGYVTTLLGRRRYIPDINSRNWNVRGFAERTAINMPIQGTAADIIKLAMINVQEYIVSNSLKSKMLLQVHDELVFEVHETESEFFPDKIKELMEGAFELAVPLKVEMGIGKNWLEAH